MSSVNMKAPGRLGDASMQPQDDPRLHPHLRAGFAHARAPEIPEITATVDSPLPEIKPFIDFLDKMGQGMYDNIPLALPGDENAKVDESTETIKGVDGNNIILYISKPTGATGPLPGVLYIHGGGMVNLTTYNQVHNAWRKDIALQGLVVVAVDFRNAYLPDGSHNPFPAGLNDCSSAVDWVHEHRSQLGISKLVIQGESGGGNLTLATALKAKKEERLDHIDGVYATVPFISGEWHQSEEWRLQHYPSMVENDTYVIAMPLMGLASVWYDPERKEKNNPLAWPSKATAEDLKGLPPHVIVVNELDPLRDEGWEYFRKLQDAGVSVVGKMNLGMVHAAELIFRQGVYQARMDQIRDIKSFAYSL